MRTRIVLLCGLSELATCSWILENEALGDDVRNILVVYGRKISMPPAHTKATLDLAPAFGVWDTVIDITDWSESAARALAGGQVVMPRKDIGALLGQASEIFTHTLWRPFEQYMLDLAPDASIILFDNGLDSHNHRTLENDRDGGSTNGSVRMVDLERVRVAYYTLGDILPIPDFAGQVQTIVPTAGQLRHHWGGIAMSPYFRKQPPDGSNRTAAVLIGTSFYRLGKFRAKDEAAVYAAFSGKAVQNGFDVVWKSHPRAGVDLSGMQSGHSEPLHQSVPIELLPCLRPVAWSASISSTALLTLKKVYGIPYKLLGLALSEKLALPWLPFLKEHAAVSFPHAEKG